MPRRLMLLLMCAVLATLWTPPQSIAAQTVCAEGGCKVFLPVVSVPEHMRIIGLEVVPDRYCSHSALEVRVDNVGQELVTGFRLTGSIRISGSETVPVDQTVTNQNLYPARVARVYISLTDCSEPVEVNFKVSAVVVVHKRFVPLTVVSTQIVEPACGYRLLTYIVVGELRNNSSMKLSDIVVLIEADERSDAAAAMSVLKPGESTRYTGSFDQSNYSNFCDPPRNPVIVQAWGEPAP